MKKRRTSIIAFLLCACLTIAVGYAALTDTFTITGDAYATTDVAQPAFDKKVYFLAANKGPDSGSSSTTPNEYGVGTADPDTAFFNIYSLAKKGESASFTYTIKNESKEYAAKIVIDTKDSTNSQFYKIVAEFVNGNDTVQTESTIDVIVTVEMLKTPTEDTTGSFTIVMTATAVEPTP